MLSEEAKLVREEVARLGRGDVDGVAELFHRNAIYNPSMVDLVGTRVVIGRDAIREAVQHLVDAEVTFDLVNAHSVAEGVAIGYGGAYIAGESIGSFLVVVHIVDGKIQLFEGHLYDRPTVPANGVTPRDAVTM